MLGVDIKFYVIQLTMRKGCHVQVPTTGTVKDIKETFCKEIPELTAHRTLKATIKQAVDNLQKNQSMLWLLKEPRLVYFSHCIMAAFFKGEFF